jgi:hypothetical protein
MEQYLVSITAVQYLELLQAHTHTHTHYIVQHCLHANDGV